DFRAGKFVRRDMARCGRSRKGGIFWNADVAGEVIFARVLAFFQLNVLTWKAPATSGQVPTAGSGYILSPDRCFPGFPESIGSGFSFDRDRRKSLDQCRCSS